MTRQSRALALGGLICTAVAACSVGPTYHRPDIAPPTQWREGPQAAATSPWPEAGWWHGFGSSQLDELIAEAEHNNDDLAGAIARVQEADAQVRIAGAPLFPTLDLGADATRQRTAVPGSGPRLTNIFNPQFTASYELDFWGKNRALRNAARATAMASRFDQQTVALTVVRSVAGTYFQALEFLDRIRVARQNLENGQKILHGLELEQSAGTATGLDVAQQETAVALLDAALPPLLQQYRQSVYALAVLVGKTPESIDVTSGSLTEISSPAIAAGLPSQLLSRRPDVAEAEQQLVAANADITVARAALFPDIALTASGGYESSRLASLISPANRVYALSAGLTQPIFHGGALRGQVSYSEARYTELLTTYHKTVLMAFSNVESALVAAQQTADQQERQRRAVAKARRAFEFAQTQMSAGTVNILTVLNTENALFSAQDVLVQVEYSHLQALIDLYTALGGGWQQG
ncbi:MAG: outer membrane protein multidrug efflux system [Gammaproteobacteria bacterium]|jgi:multidrug efflux system outer membrane protein|nr:outer membrane protein multidrug efflux system [Gammaproteobacteria bacterium]